jgi:RNA polymerase sigma-70 factor (ECF subfamily)
MNDASDDVLWRRSARGEHDAFERLFERHARRVFGFCFRQTGDAATAEDLTSITFLEAWRRRNIVIDEGKVVPWLLGVANNAVRHQRRSARRYRRALGRLPPPAAVADHADEAADRLLAEQEARAVLSHLARLPKLERSVLALVAWEGLTPAEAAYALDVPEGTVRSRLHRARKRLGGATVRQPNDVATVTSSSQSAKGPACNGTSL